MNKVVDSKVSKDPKEVSSLDSSRGASSLSTSTSDVLAKEARANIESDFVANQVLHASLRLEEFRDKKGSESEIKKLEEFIEIGIDKLVRSASGRSEEEISSDKQVIKDNLGRIVLEQKEERRVEGVLIELADKKLSREELDRELSKIPDLNKEEALKVMARYELEGVASQYRGALRVVVNKRDGEDALRLDLSLSLETAVPNESPRDKNHRERLSKVHEERVENLLAKYEGILTREGINAVCKVEGEESLVNLYLSKTKDMPWETRRLALDSAGVFKPETNPANLFRENVYKRELAETTSRMLQLSYEIGYFDTPGNRGDFSCKTRCQAGREEREKLKTRLEHLVKDIPEGFPERDKILEEIKQFNIKLGESEVQGYLAFSKFKEGQDQEAKVDYERRAKEGGALFAAQEIFSEAGSNLVHLKEWGELNTLGVYESTSGLIKGQGFKRGAEFVEKQRKFYNEHSKAGSIFGSDAEFSSKTDWELGLEVSAWGGVNHFAGGTISPILGLADIGRVQLQRGAGYIGEASVGLYTGDETVGLSYSQYRDLEKTDSLLKTAKYSYEVAEIAAGLALGKPDSLGTLGRRLLVSGGMGVASAASVQLMGDESFDLSKFFEDTLSNTAGSQMFSGVMQLGSSVWIRARAGSILTKLNKGQALIPDEMAFLEKTVKQAQAVTQGIDFFDGHADLKDALVNFKNVGDIAKANGVRKLLGAILQTGVAGFDTVDVGMLASGGKQILGKLANARANSSNEAVSVPTLDETSIEGIGVSNASGLEGLTLTEVDANAREEIIAAARDNKDKLIFEKNEITLEPEGVAEEIDIKSNMPGILETLGQNYDLKNIDTLTEKSLLVVEKLAIALKSSIPDSSSLSCCLVGGWCRDLIMGRASSDVDIEVFGVTYEELIDVLKNNFDCHIIEPSKPGVAPIKLILSDGISIDIILPIESDLETREYRYAPEKEISEAASRRDFTCNSIYFDAVNKEWKDPFDGKSDIDQGILRLLPTTKVEEINAGIPLRACRFVAEFDFVLDEQSKDLIKKAISEGLYNQQEKRILTAEFSKILLKTKNPSKALRLADELGILSVVIPELSALRGIPQDPHHHPEGDVFEHTMLVVDAAAQNSKHLDSRERTKILWGALLHDIGKASTTRIEEGNGRTKITAYNHELEGAKIVGEILDRFDVASDIRNQVARIVQLHMRPLEIDSRKLLPNSIAKFDNEVRKLVRDLHPVDLETFLLVCSADRMGRGSAIEPIQPSSGILQNIRESNIRNKYTDRPINRLVNGKYLEELGFANTDNMFQKIIQRVEDLRDKNKLQTAEDAKRLILNTFALSESEVENAGINTAELKQSFYIRLKQEIREGRITTVSQCRLLLDGFTKANQSSSSYLNPFNLSVAQQEQLFAARWSRIESQVLPHLYTAVYRVLDNTFDLARVPIRLVSKDEGSRQAKRIFENLLPNADNHILGELIESVDKTEGFYSGHDDVVYLLKDNILGTFAPDLEYLIVHEIIHAWQAKSFPQFEHQLSYLMKEYMLCRAGDVRLTTFSLEDIQKSVQARYDWREFHAETITDAIESSQDLDIPLEDIEVDLDTVFKVKGNFGKVSLATFNELSKIIFNCPELADLLFRGDSVVLVTSSDQESIKARIDLFLTSRGINLDLIYP